jgi:hypothetical protein
VLAAPLLTKHDLPRGIGEGPRRFGRSLPPLESREAVLDPIEPAISDTGYLAGDNAHICVNAAASDCQSREFELRPP